MKLSLDGLYPLNEISELLMPGEGAWLVGGTVRDIALGRRTGDVDLAFSGDVRGFADRVAERLGGTAFVMDAERDVYRVAEKGDPPVQVDVSPLKGDIREDLASRDFTVNAMAVELSGTGGRVLEVVDPFGGLDDLEAGLIRALGEDAFADDPLRLLRAFRLAGQLGFSVEEYTLSMIRRLAPAIRNVSAERVRDEIYMVLEGEGSAGVFRKMSEAGLLREVIPETGPMEGLPQGEPHVHDLMEHSLKAMEYAEEILRDAGRYFGPRAVEVERYLRTAVDGGLSMRGLVKLCAFLHDVGKPACMKAGGGRIRFIGHDEEGARTSGEIALRLKLSTRASEVLAAATRHHMRPLHLSQERATRHALYRYARDVGEDLPSSLVVALADAFATRDRPDALVTDVEGLARDAAEYYFGEYRKAKEEPLVRGRDLIETFGLEPGPVFKRILEELEEKRAEGALATRDEAIEYVRKNLESFLKG